VRKACFDIISSPIGKIFAALSDVGVCMVVVNITTLRQAYQVAFRLRVELMGRSAKELSSFRRELEAYFATGLKRFSSKPDLTGMTEFDRSVSGEVMRIPYGRTASYGDISRRIGRPKAARAVGSANARNPVPLIIPCHRVILSNGSFGQYGGGRAMKKWLLDLESV